MSRFFSYFPPTFFKFSVQSTVPSLGEWAQKPVFWDSNAYTTTCCNKTLCELYNLPVPQLLDFTFLTCKVGIIVVSCCRKLVWVPWVNRSSVLPGTQQVFNIIVVTFRIRGKLLQKLKFMIYYTFPLLLYDMLLRIKQQMYKICGTMDEKTIKQKILVMEWTTIKLAIQIKKY